MMVTTDDADDATKRSPLAAPKIPKSRPQDALQIPRLQATGAAAQVRAAGRSVACNAIAGAKAELTVPSRRQRVVFDAAADIRTTWPHDRMDADDAESTAEQQQQQLR